MGTVSLPSASFSESERNRPVAADVFRAVAVGMVGWFHIWQQSWQGAGEFTYLARTGAVWVDGMIMLSAFCLFLPYANLYAENRQRTAVKPIAFYKKRLLRILPSYYVSVLAALAMALYQKGPSLLLWKDLAAHLTLTQSFFPFSYWYTNLNGASWTLTILTLFYLAFPFLVRIMLRAPLWAGMALFAIQIYWQHTAVPLYGTPAYQMRFNQLPAFASTIAIGMWGALLFAAAARSKWLQNWGMRSLSTILGFGALGFINHLLKQLNWSREFQLWQLQNRTTLVCGMMLALLLFALGLPLPGKRLWAFLAGISYNFYLWHQMLTVWLKYTFHLPFWSGEVPPNQLGDTVWMAKSNLLYWAAALTVAIVLTWLVDNTMLKIAKKKSKKTNNSGTLPEKVV